MPTVRIALANIRPARSPADSVEQTVLAIRQAAAEHAMIVCLPEAYVPGYRVGARSVPPPDASFLERAWSDIAETAQQSNTAVVLGTERVVDERPRISVLVIDRNGTRLGFQDKVQLDPSEDATYSAGAERQVFRVGALAFGVSICHEGWRYPETVRWPARHGAHLVFHPHFHEAEPDAYRPSVFLDPENTFHEKAMLCRAAENTCWFASVNCACEGSSSTSAVIRPDGSVLAWHPYGVHGLLVADIETELGTGFLASRWKT